MATRTGRKIAHYAAGGGALPTDATAQGMPAATPALGYTPGANTNAAGSWGAGAESGGIAGDSSISPVGAAPAWSGPSTTGDYVPPPPPMQAAAAPTVAATPSPTRWFKEGGAIPDKVEHFAGGGRSGHGGYKIAGDPNATLNEDNDMVAKFNQQARTHVSRRFTDTAETTAPPGGQQQQQQPSGGGGGGEGKRRGGGGGQQPSGGGQQPSGGQQPQQQSSWSGGLDSLPGGGGGNSTGSGSTTTSPSPGAPTDALGSQAYPPAQPDPSSSSAIPDGSTAGQGGVPTDAMGSGGTGGGISMTGGGGARGGRVTPKGIVPPEEPYRQKWRAKNGKKQTPYRAMADGGAVDESTPAQPNNPNDPISQDMGNFASDGSPLGPEGAEMGNPKVVGSQTPGMAEGGAIPDTADVPIDQDQGQEGDAGDLYAQVKSVLSQTRQSYGLTDKAFQMAGNMPTKPAGPGGDQTQGGPQDRSNPPPVSENNDDDSEKQAVS